MLLPGRISRPTLNNFLAIKAKFSNSTGIWSSKNKGVAGGGVYCSNWAKICFVVAIKELIHILYF